MDPRAIEQCLAGLRQLPPGSPQFDAAAATLVRRGAPAESVHSRFAERAADPLRDRTLPTARSAVTGLAAAVARLRELLRTVDPQAGHRFLGLRRGSRQSWAERVRAHSGELSDALAQLRREGDDLLRHRVSLQRESELTTTLRAELERELDELRVLCDRVEQLGGQADPARAEALRSGPLAQLTAARADVLARLGVLQHHELSLAAVLQISDEVLAAVRRADTSAARALDTAVTASGAVTAGDQLAELVGRAVAALEAAAEAADEV